MQIKVSLKKTATLAFILYMLCLFWILILKCNLRQAVLETRFTYENIPFSERILIFMGKFSTTNINEATMNVVAFVPMGIIVPHISKKKPYLNAAMAGLFTSLAAELCQLITAFGGFTYIDIINNSIGTFLGVIISCLLMRTVKEKWLNIGMITVSALATPLLIYAIFNTAKNIDIYIMPPGMLL